MEVKVPRFSLMLARLTINTFIAIIVPPGECTFNTMKLNVIKSQPVFERLDGTVQFRPDRGQTSTPEIIGNDEDNQLAESTASMALNEGV